MQPSIFSGPVLKISLVVCFSVRLLAMSVFSDNRFACLCWVIVDAFFGRGLKLDP